MNKNGYCRNKYFKEFCLIIMYGEKFYFKYKRCDDGDNVKVWGVILDNIYG